MTSNTIYTSRAEFKPTYLYIKQHAITGKLYFGKTIKNPEKYMGSGTYWKKHIRKHGKKFVINLWYELFTNMHELTHFALLFSTEMDIVNSEQWANLIVETGVDNATGMLGKHHTTDTIKMMSGENHYAYGKTYEELFGEIAASNRKSNHSKLMTGELNPAYGKPGGMLGKHQSDEMKSNASKRQLGIPRTENTKIKLRKSKPKFECENCHKLIGGMNNLIQHQRSRKCLPFSNPEIILV